MVPLIQSIGFPPCLWIFCVCVWLLTGRWSPTGVRINIVWKWGNNIGFSILTRTTCLTVRCTYSTCSIAGYRYTLISFDYGWLIVGQDEIFPGERSVSGENKIPPVIDYHLQWRFVGVQVEISNSEDISLFLLYFFFFCLRACPCLYVPRLEHGFNFEPRNSWCWVLGPFPLGNFTISIGTGRCRFSSRSLRNAPREPITTAIDFYSAASSRRYLGRRKEGIFGRSRENIVPRSTRYWCSYWWWWLLLLLLSSVNSRETILVAGW